MMNTKYRMFMTRVLDFFFSLIWNIKLVSYFWSPVSSFWMCFLT